MSSKTELYDQRAAVLAVQLRADCPLFDWHTFSWEEREQLLPEIGVSTDCDRDGRILLARGRFRMFGDDYGFFCGAHTDELMADGLPQVARRMIGLALDRVADALGFGAEGAFDDGR